VAGDLASARESRPDRNAGPLARGEVRSRRIRSRKLRQVIADAWEENGRGRLGFEAMCRVYVQFAVAHPSHYRVMFGRFFESAAKDDDFVAEAKAAFQVLVDALIEQQNAGAIRNDEPVQMARFVWAVVHGTAMLAIDGQVAEAAQREALELYSVERTYASIRQERLRSG
jgi:Tetracyclin repressor-like, C-terminal domain